MIDGKRGEGKFLDADAKLDRLARLFRAISDLTKQAHPLCKECVQKHLKALETQSAEAVKENSSYKQFLRKLLAEKERYPLEDQLDQEISSIEAEEHALVEELEKLKMQRRALREESETLHQHAQSISELQKRYWENFTEYQRELQQFQEDSNTVRMKVENCREQLDRLKSTDVYNDTFHIWHDGHFGTINNFRLGRLPSQPVDWNEINAAWGQTTLLLYTLAKKLNFTFSTYRLFPMGSNSKMERISDKSTYELFGSSDVSLGRLFWYRRFDNGMVAFLGCLKELGDFAEAKDKAFRLPYRIEKEKINEMSIRMQFNNEETWTKALKYMLTNLKFLLVWLAKET
eukprot:TRINITY_DN4177_c0_g1_i1.p1 TRINITY_DN4177_c0_g1~~TRINITY_DN4177_c0_g1_i1.p1  ORF type:complete len:400 (+),score=81.72 TRINITY_DN4177_c0_g1_i1:168-1202(+)